MNAEPMTDGERVAVMLELYTELRKAMIDPAYRCRETEAFLLCDLANEGKPCRCSELDRLEETRS